VSFRCRILHGFTDAAASLLDDDSLVTRGGSVGACRGRGTIDPALSPRNASYIIDAKLDITSRTITGSEVILWRNITTKPATELQFHLYWNAWRDDHSTWLRETKLGSRRTVPVVRPDERARIDVTSLGVRGNARADLTTVMRFIAPDDGNADDRTVLAARLPQAVAPGASLTIELTWTAHVPRTFARTGVIGNYFSSRSGFPSSACCRIRDGTAISSTAARSSSPTTARTTCA